MSAASTAGHEPIRLLIAGALGAFCASPAGMAMISQTGPHAQNPAGAWLQAVVACGALLGIVFLVSVMLDWRRGNARRTAIRAFAGLGLGSIELGAVAAFYVFFDRLTAPGSSAETLAVTILGLGFYLSFAVAACAISMAVVFAVTPSVSALPMRDLRMRWLLLGVVTGVGAALGVWLYVVLSLFISFLLAPDMLVSDAIVVTIFIGVAGLFSAAMMLAYTLPGFLLGAMLGGYLRVWRGASR